MFSKTMQGNFSAERFLQDERSRKVRHEYVAGEVYAMAGASAHHNLIAGNCYVALRLHYRGTARRVFQENLLVKINWLPEPVFYYPDVMVCCDPRDNMDEYFCERPCLLVEVLSDSTARIDRNEKLRAYSQIQSLHAYLIVSQQAMHVVVYGRDRDWAPVILTAPEDTVTLDCDPAHPPLTMSLAQIYESIF